MHGLGNSFVLMDDRRGEISDRVDPAAFTIAVCDPNTGVGADGLILIQSGKRTDLRMRIINRDGSEAEMCGNGVRCFARHVFDAGLAATRELRVETLAGVISTQILDDGRVEVDMGQPELESDDACATSHGGRLRVSIEGREYTFVSLGNPHAVAFVDDFDFNWEAVGATVEHHEAFPNKANVHFALVGGLRDVEVKVWERGCGATQACGTGACAVAVAGAMEGRLSREPVTIHLPGGDLVVHWNDQDRVIMTGPAERICRGTYFLGSPTKSMG